MGKDLHDAFPRAREVFDEAEESVAKSLRKLCFELSPEELRETQNAQLALVTHAAAMWAVLRQHDDAPAVAAAGHSVGEYAAFHAAATLSLPSLVRLVDIRGRAMAEAGRAQPGAMAAVLGRGEPGVDELCERASREGSTVVPANYNAPEQVVVSGHVDAVERLMQLARDSGASKVVRLNVSGAFHSPLMEGAQGDLQDALESCDMADPVMAVYCNVSGERCESGVEARAQLARQLAAPVRWVDLMRGIERDYPESVCLEIGPGNVLAGLVRRCAPSLKTLPCGAAKDLDNIVKVLA
jgi:[acyl-carrier-protein] S-malonyltransferase